METKILGTCHKCKKPGERCRPLFKSSEEKCEIKICDICSEKEVIRQDGQTIWFCKAHAAEVISDEEKVEESASKPLVALSPEVNVGASTSSEIKTKVTPAENTGNITNNNKSSTNAAQASTGTLAASYNMPSAPPTQQMRAHHAEGVSGINNIHPNSEFVTVRRHNNSFSSDPPETDYACKICGYYIQEERILKCFSCREVFHSSCAGNIYARTAYAESNTYFNIFSCRRCTAKTISLESNRQDYSMEFQNQNLGMHNNNGRGPFNFPPRRGRPFERYAQSGNRPSVYFSDTEQYNRVRSNSEYTTPFRPTGRSTGYFGNQNTVINNGYNFRNNNPLGANTTTPYNHTQNTTNNERSMLPHQANFQRVTEAIKCPTVIKLFETAMEEINNELKIKDTLQEDYNNILARAKTREDKPDQVYDLLMDLAHLANKAKITNRTYFLTGKRNVYPLIEKLPHDVFKKCEMELAVKSKGLDDKFSLFVLEKILINSRALYKIRMEREKQKLQEKIQAQNLINSYNKTQRTHNTYDEEASKKRYPSKYCWFHDTDQHGSSRCEHLWNINGEAVRKLAKEKGICNGCGFNKHDGSCSDKLKCNIEGCDLKHFALFCDKRIPKKKNVTHMKQLSMKTKMR